MGRAIIKKMVEQNAVLAYVKSFFIAEHLGTNHSSVCPANNLVGEFSRQRSSISS